MAKDPSGANEIGPNSKMRLATVVIVVAACCAAAAWCTTTTIGQSRATERMEWMTKHIESLETRIDADHTTNERHYDSIRKSIDDVRYRLGYEPRTSTRNHSDPDPTD
jgi:hypothetical protein